ncbi:MAG: hypothetical protein LUI04_07255 [Porphyromonadaceae bacterium]|nr:hypothetical protein [Porphyromonadaceae bacterium]
MENEASKEEKKGRGGHREGAGRKPRTGDPYVCAIHTLLTQKAADNLSRFVKEKGMPRNAVLIELLENLYTD